MSKLIALLCGLVACAVFAASVDYAEAARIGGGRSFGGKSFMSRPAQQPSSFMNQSQASRQQAAASAPSAKRPGFGGMFGGLLAGSLLGSMLFGGGAMGGLMNLVIIGGLVYLAYRFLSSLRRARTERRGDAAGARQYGEHQYQYQTAPPSPGWDHLRGFGSGSGMNSGMGPASGFGAGSDAEASASSANPYADRVHIAGNFDAEEFLRGAKAAYTRLQASWDKRDIDDIAQFGTPAFMQTIREQAAEDPTPGKTDILLINADLIDVREESGEQMASVFFSVVMREDPRMSGTSDVREVWHFVRNGDGSGSWKLDGIQQVEM